MKDATIKNKSALQRYMKLSEIEEKTWKRTKGGVLCRVSPGSTEYSNVTK